jgi:hypothetical protein
MGAGVRESTADMMESYVVPSAGVGEKDDKYTGEQERRCLTVRLSTAKRLEDVAGCESSCHSP